MPSGIAEPISVFVDTHGAVCSRNPKLADMTDGEIARRIAKLFDLRPAAIVKKFGLKNPIFEATASYGHFGQPPLHPQGESVGGRPRGGTRDRILRLGKARCRRSDQARVRTITRPTAQVKSPLFGDFLLLAPDGIEPPNSFGLLKPKNKLRDGRSMQVPEPPGNTPRGP